MPHENIDLFAEQPAHAPAADAGQLAQLEALLADAGRKGALKAMSPEQKDTLARAVTAVAQAKRVAYEQAIAGGKPSASGWLVREPALADAVARVHAAFLDCGAITMAGA